MNMGTNLIKWKVQVPIFPPGPNSINTWERRKNLIGNANYTGLYGVTLNKGYGAFIEDVDGNIYLDCLACASSCVLGYGQEFLARSFYEQSKKLQQSCFTYSINTPALDLAEKLISLMPGDFEKRVMIGLSGSDSSGGAIKAMRKFTQIDGVIHFKNDYHGSTGLSQQASNYGDLDDGIYSNNPNFFEFDFPRNDHEVERVLAEIRLKLENKTAGGIICEAIQGDAGVVVPPKGFIKALRKTTEETNSVLIIDEVQSGMGRTGKWWSYEHEGIVPDLMVVAKGLSSGYAPISAVVGRKDIINKLGSGQHIFTYGGHPPSAAVAKCVLDFIDSENIPENCEQIGDYLLENLESIQIEYPKIIKDVRGKGLMIGVQIDISDDKDMGKIFATRCMELGVYVGFFGVKGDVVRIEPPLTIGVEEADLIINTIRTVSLEVKENKIPKQTKLNVTKFSIGI